MHPGQRNSLDALCKRYEVDASSRHKHGALIDSELLARQYGGSSTSIVQSTPPLYSNVPQLPG